MCIVSYRNVSTSCSPSSFTPRAHCPSISTRIHLHISINTASQEPPRKKQK